MTEKKEKASGPPKPLISRSPDLKTLYVTGAIGNFTPFDFRLSFYSHQEQWPEKPKQVAGVPISQVMQVTLVMSPDLAKRLRDMLDSQLKEREKTLEQEKKAKAI